MGPSLSLRLNPAIYYPQADETETNVMTGTIAQGSQWLSDLRAYRNSTGNSNLYAGAYTLLIEKPGYLPQKLGPVDVTKKDLNVGDIAIWKA